MIKAKQNKTKLHFTTLSWMEKKNKYQELNT